MCYSGSCSSELPSGACGHRPSNGPRPCSFENEEEYYEAIESLKDEKADYLYEQWKDRQLESHPRSFR